MCIGADNGILPAGTEGMGAGALEDLLGDLPTIDGAVRNSVASRASLRYDGSEDADRVSRSPASSTQVRQLLPAAPIPVLKLDIDMPEDGCMRNS